MSVVGDLRVLARMATPFLAPSHAERMEGFYSGQARDYDDFRRRLLHGRDELMTSLPLEPGAVWLDFGGGTGSNLETVAEKIPSLEKAYIVDLSTSLLRVAAERVQSNRWSNVVPVSGDATTWNPPERQVDAVTFSYSLTMIPDWFTAVENAYRLLKPGGAIGVVDFYVARKHAAAGHARHAWTTRSFWPLWFALDNVFLSGDHLPFLESRFETLRRVERRARVPYLPFVRAPYYLFIGRKPLDAAAT